MIRPRRSLLFMPGSNARALEKARNLPADGLILDLEDSVAPEAKALARDQIAKAVAAGGFGKREILIRVNALDSPWWIDDVTMAGKAKPDGILVPKISTVADLSDVADRLTDISAGGCYVEMPTPFSAGTRVEIVVRTQEMKLKTHGVVQSVHQGFGMGVKLTLQSPEDREQVRSLIRLLEESGENAELGPISDPWTR